jgi:hypothetical protein
VLQCSQRLGRRVATAHLLQLTLMFYLGAVMKSQHMSAPGQLRASFAIFGMVYALQVQARVWLTHIYSTQHFALETAQGLSRSLPCTAADTACWLQATRMIMCHMCKEPFEVFWWPMTLLVVVIGNSYLQACDFNRAAFAVLCVLYQRELDVACTFMMSCQYAANADH